MSNRHLRTAFFDLVDGLAAQGSPNHACASCERASRLHRDFEHEMKSVMASLAVEPLPARTLELPQPRHRLQLSGVSAAVLAVALIAAVVVIGVARGQLSFTPAIQPGGAAALQEAATIAASAEPQHVGDGYLYTHTEALWRGTEVWGPELEFTYLQPVSREIWLAADGSGRLRETVGEHIFLSDADRAAWMAVGSPPIHANNIDFAPGEGAFFDASVLPTDVDELRAHVRSRAEQADRRPIEVGMFVTIGDFLRETVAPPEVRAALFEVAATLPGIELLGDMTDHAGRTGVGVAMTDGAIQEVLIFDPNTSALLEHRTIGLEAYGDHQPPVLWGYATYMESAIVPELPLEDDVP